MCARAVVMFFYALLLVRVAGIRTLGRQSAFDTITTLIMGAILGRAVVAEQSFVGTILASLVIVLLHRFIAWITFKSRAAGKIFKGENLPLYQSGKQNEKNLARQQITNEDIRSALRQCLHCESLDDIKEIHIERSGEISFIRNEQKKT